MSCVESYAQDGIASAHMAHILMLMQLTEQASNELKEALQYAPDHPVVMRNLARYLLRINQPMQAFEAAKAAFQRGGRNHENRLVMAATLAAINQFDQALLLVNEVLSDSPRYAEALASRAQLMHRSGDVIAALGDAELALEIKPHLLSLWPLVADLRYRNGNLLGAINALDIALRADSSNVRLLVSQGEFLRLARRLEDAIAVLEKAVSLAPANAMAWANLGTALQSKGQVEAAMQAYEKALEINPSMAQVAHNLGVLAHQTGEYTGALQRFEQALQLQPDSIQFLASLAAVKLKLRYPPEEIEQIALLLMKRSPNDPLGPALFGSLCNELGRLEEAASWYQKALLLDPGASECLAALGGILKELGNLSESERLLKAAIERNPHDLKSFSNLLFCQHYNPVHSPEVLLRSARRYGSLVSESIQKQFSNWPRLFESSEHGLRVGLVSGDFRSHPVGYFIESILSQCFGGGIDFFAYSNRNSSHDDFLTERIKSKVSAWKSIADLSDKAAAALIRNDGIHILIDLSGHTAFNRLPIFAWRPAPVQVSWLGYFATTGVREIDWLLADSFVVVDGEQSHFVEKIWRLPECYLCFTPPDFNLEVSSLPALDSGVITFGSFNNLTKMTDAVVELWSRIIRNVPNSRLYLKYRQLNDQKIVDRTHELFARHGVAPERLLLEGASPRKELLAAYSKVDIGLDPFPYPGGTTTLEALWMGVPVLTRCGDRFLSRVGETIATNAGLTDWIAANDDEYVAKAEAFACDLVSLARLRDGLRVQVLASPLFDALRFARHFEEAMRGMWMFWLERERKK